MDGWEIAVIVVAALAVLALAAYLVVQQQRSRRLRSRFGPEYDRVIDVRGGRRSGERALHERLDRRDRLDVRPLPREASDRYGEEWRKIQARFVDEPGGALVDADRLVAGVMHDRGYPVDDFDEQADLVSVDHPRVVEHYRRGHDLFLRYRAGDASTEDLRDAMLSYRALFRELLVTEDDSDVRTTGHRR